MNCFLFFLLAPSATKGGITVAVIFLLCFIGVHAVKLSSIGYKTFQKEEPEAEPKPEHKPPQRRVRKRAISSPVYYLVERKTTPPQEEEQYYKPKRIEFEE